MLESSGAELATPEAEPPCVPLVCSLPGILLASENFKSPSPGGIFLRKIVAVIAVDQSLSRCFPPDGPTSFPPFRIACVCAC